MLPAVPWFRPAAFIHRHLAMIALRSSTSSFFISTPVADRRFFRCRSGSPLASLPCSLAPAIRLHRASAGRRKAGSAPAHVAATTLRRTRARGRALVLVPKDDPALVEIIGAHLDSDAVPLDRLDPVLLHLA